MISLGKHKSSSAESIADPHSSGSEELEFLRHEVARLTGEVRQIHSEMEQFMYIASHDLQEPLRMISSYSALLTNSLGTTLPDDGLRWLNYVSAAASKLQKRILDLIAYSRLGTPEYQFIQVDLATVIGEVLQMLEPQIYESNASIRLGSLPVVWGNKTLLSSLFQNLITNALKFRHKDRNPEIDIGCSHSKDQFMVTVADNGIGIRSESLERIFILFHRLHNENEYPGTGVGLAICRRIIDKHDGVIAASSVPGMGTTFVCTFPKRDT
jgi:light-regulated signal transduction histidine kinase (bacteriophytochrome)